MRLQINYFIREFGMVTNSELQVSFIYYGYLTHICFRDAKVLTDKSNHAQAIMDIPDQHLLQRFFNCYAYI
jgi:hypothetical protein